MASVQSSGGARRAGIVGINITPMVDVVLVLLVIMMVSATYIVSQSLQVGLPKTATSDDSPATVAAVTLTKTGGITYNGEPVSEPDLLKKLREVYAANKDVSLVLSADRDASHGSVVHVIDVAKLIGITSFAINVERAAD
jgi:biopolymer transport protein ExbD